MSTTKTDGLFLRTQTLAVNSSSDSIRFVRWVGFTDLNTRSYEGDSGTTAFNTWIDSVAADGSIEHNPPTTSFATGSTILYIVEVRNASTDAILDRIDTVKVFRNSNGDLRWRHYRGYTGSPAFRSLAPYYGQTIYFNVSRVENLPSGVSLRHEFNVMDNQQGLLQLGSQGAVGPIALYPLGGSAPNSRVEGVTRRAHVAIYPNPTNGILSVRMASDWVGDGYLLIRNSIGQIEYIKKLALTVGEFSTPVDARELSQGVYTLSIVSRDKAIIYAQEPFVISR